MNKDNYGLEFKFPQEPLWNESLAAVRGAQNLSILTDARALSSILHFNSGETRDRYGQAIATRFSRLDPLVLAGFFQIIKDGINSKVIESIWRILFCLAEPIVSRIYLEMLWPREPGSQLLRSEMRNYIEATYHQQSMKLNTRAINCLRQAGFVSPQGKDLLYIVGFGDLDASLYLATHLLYSQEPKTIKIAEIENMDYWKLLGYRKFDYVKIALRNAESKGLIMRYATADHLEQITTKYPWTDFLSHWKEFYENPRV
jgi:hypothetical protein